LHLVILAGRFLFPDKVNTLPFTQEKVEKENDDFIVAPNTSNFSISVKNNFNSVQ